MAHGRHRYASRLWMVLRWIVVGMLAVSGVTIAMFRSEPWLLRLAVCSAFAVTVLILTLLQTRQREHERQLVEVSGRRRDQLIVQDEIASLRSVVSTLGTQVSTLSEQTANLARRMPQPPVPLTSQAFEKAAAALESTAAVTAQVWAIESVAAIPELEAAVPKASPAIAANPETASAATAPARGKKGRRAPGNARRPAPVRVAADDDDHDDSDDDDSDFRSGDSQPLETVEFR